MHRNGPLLAWDCRGAGHRAERILQPDPPPPPSPPVAGDRPVTPAADRQQLFVLCLLPDPLSRWPGEAGFASAAAAADRDSPPIHYRYFSILPPTPAAAPANYALALQLAGRSAGAEVARPPGVCADGPNDESLTARSARLQPRDLTRGLSPCSPCDTTRRCARQLGPGGQEADPRRRLRCSGARRCDGPPLRAVPFVARDLPYYGPSIGCALQPKRRRPLPVADLPRFDRPHANPARYLDIRPDAGTRRCHYRNWQTLMQSHRGSRSLRPARLSDGPCRARRLTPTFSVGGRDDRLTGRARCPFVSCSKPARARTAADRPGFYWAARAPRAASGPRPMAFLHSREPDIFTPLCDGAARRTPSPPTASPPPDATRGRFGRRHWRGAPLLARSAARRGPLLAHWRRAWRSREPCRSREFGRRAGGPISASGCRGGRNRARISTTGAASPRSGFRPPTARTGRRRTASSARKARSIGPQCRRSARVA